MQRNTFWASLTLGLALAGCARPEAVADAPQAHTAPAHPEQEAMHDAPHASTRLHVGWYREHGGQGLFQPCGSETVYRVSAQPELRSRARGFGLQPDTPVYVRLEAAMERDTLEVARVVQFGSPTPVRDCPMTGVVTRDEG